MRNPARRTLQAEESEAAGREGRKSVELPHLVTHDLRHLYASALIAGGASVRQVRTVLGHASAVIMLRIHADLRPGEEDRTRPVMVAVLGGPADRVRAGRRHDQRNRRSDGLAGDQAFLVSQKILSTSAIRSRAF
nr:MULTISPECIES: tyrosine-type recombinase/integrase [unclassified Streptomyces]